VYLPPHFEEKRVEVLHGLIREHPLGTLVNTGPAGLNANHLPFLIDPEPAPFGTLHGHVARANPVWRDHDPEVLVVFQGSRAYISPSWYETKRATGKVVPTYNYIVLHAHGRLRVLDGGDGLRAHIEHLVRHFESGMVSPWKVDDAPADYIEQMLKGIVGIQIPVERLLGKWKVSQNRTAADREGAAAALESAGAGDMAAAVRKASS
jgi:transcriptional regulator